MSNLLVSILVLLEIGLGVYPNASELVPSSSFNPCFVGNRSGRLNTGVTNVNAKRFQSLFCWKSVWELLIVLYPIDISLFQSLFCWKSVWELNTSAVFPISRKVSILVLLEIGLGVAINHLLHLSCTKFQSLFCWKSVWEYYAAQSYCMKNRCFNPCFVGNRSGSSGRDWNKSSMDDVSILVLLEIGLGED